MESEIVTSVLWLNLSSELRFFFVFFFSPNPPQTTGTENDSDYLTRCSSPYFNFKHGLTREATVP